MKFYKFIAVSNKGEKLEEANFYKDERELLYYVREKGYFLVWSKLIHKNNLMKFIYRINIKEISIFAKQLSSLLYVGFNISEALRVIYEQINNKALKKAIMAVATNVQKGNSFYESIIKYDYIFPKFFIEMVNIGEQSGNLDFVLKSLSSYYIKEYKVKRKIIAAMIYPVILLITTISILFFLEIKIVPMFSDTFSSLGAELPFYSRCIMDMSNNINNNLLIIISIILLLFSFIIAAFKINRFKYIRHKWYIKAPLIGKINKKIVGAKFSRCLGLLQKSGINILFSLELGSKVVNNTYVEEKIKDAVMHVKNGEGIAETLDKIKIFPSFIISMIALGEQGGNLDEMLVMASDIYDEDIEDVLCKLVNIIEPAMIIILGLLVGSVIFAVMMPMLKIMQNV